MRKNTRSLCTTYAFFVLAAAVANALLTSVIYTKHYDFDKCLWESGAPTHLGFACLAVTLLGLASVFFVFPKDCFKAEPGRTGGFYVKLTSLFCTVALLLIFCVFFLFRILDFSDPLISLFFGKNSIAQLSHRASILLSFFASIYFIIEAMSKRTSYWAELLFLLFELATLLRLYFDMNVIMTDPRRAMSIIAACLTLIYILLDARLATARAKERSYIFFAASAVCANAASGASNLYHTANGRLELGITTLFYAFEFALALFIFAKLISFLSCADEITENAKPLPEDADGDEEDEEEEEEYALEEIVERINEDPERPFVLDQDIPEGADAEECPEGKEATQADTAPVITEIAEIDEEDDIEFLEYKARKSEDDE